MTLVSFDVVSLFTKVPVDLAAKVARERLTADQSLADRTALSANEVVSLLEFCLRATYLSYRGEMFQQVFGTTMGSPVSVTVANLVMEDVEQRALTSSTIQPPFWKRYVDDTFTALPQKQIQWFHNHLNSIEPTIQFTIETEVEGTPISGHQGYPPLWWLFDHDRTRVQKKDPHMQTGIWTLTPTILWRTRSLWLARSSPEQTGSACLCLTGMLRRHTSCRPSTAMGTPQQWSRRTGKPHWHTALHLVQWHLEPQWSSHMSGMCPKPSDGSLLLWRSGPVFAHIIHYGKHW